MVKSDDPGDVANWNFGYRKGYKNLPMTSFTFFANAVSSYSDPNFDYAGGVEFYNLIRGYNKSNQPWINEATREPTKFVYSGDPVTRTG